ncbi:MAG: ankyrin repeat domain-containing protein [Verrucomicrobia bacterium]|nr:ankyrin repeat domain-containing protein [Verrucomicrobiota bacterium]
MRTLLDELLAYRANPSLAVDVGSMSKWRLRVAGVTGFVDPEDDMTVLHWATLLDHPETVKKLAAAARDVNIKSRLGLTPLHWAAAANKAQAVVALLACGADPSLKNNAGQTAADLAAKGGHAWIVQALRDAKRRAETDAHGRGHPNDTIRTDR